MAKNDENRVVGEVAVCPSFNVYCSDRHSIAARAVYEVLCTSPQPQSELDEDEFGFAARRSDEFEFEVLSEESYVEGEIGRLFPIFDCDVVFGGTEKVEMREAVDSASVSLGKRLVDEVREEREENVDSSSSSEADEVDCVWKWKRAPEVLSSGRCKSTGSSNSKRWKLCDLLLRRSNSDGKDSFVFLSPSSSSSSSSSRTEEAKSVLSKLKLARRSAGMYKASAHELFYVKNRAVKEDDKRKSYLPYRNGLLGFGFLPNGMSSTNNFRRF